MVRYHGVLSSHAKVRAEVVPKREDGAQNQLALFERDTGVLDVLALEREPRRKPWAWLLRHAFALDVSICVRCGGVTPWLETATSPEALAKASGSDRHPRVSRIDFPIRWSTSPESRIRVLCPRTSMP